MRKHRTCPELLRPEEVEALRRRLALTQQEFAMRLGVATCTVNRWEGGHASPSRLACIAMRAMGHSSLATTAAVQ